MADTPDNCMPHDNLRNLRRSYAQRILAAAQVTDAHLEAAFAHVPREDFLGPGPWPIYDVPRGCYVRSSSTDPVNVYTDDLVGLLPERHINNGQPSFHARLLSETRLRHGERVVHVGSGAGYYSAIMAHLVGLSGRVTAIEFNPELAELGAANLALYGNVRVVHGDGASVAFDMADIIYVNAGATRPADSWLDRLSNGGRLVLPLTATGLLRPDDPPNMQQRGAVFLIERSGEAFFARWISGVAIYPCVGSRDETSERALADAMRKGGGKRVTRLFRTDDLPEKRCWLRAPGWCLAYE